MRLSGGPGRPGRLRMRLDSYEAEVLRSMLADLREDLGDADAGGNTGDDPALARLFPAGYRDDDDAAAEFRSLTESGLRDARLDRIDRLLTELAQEPGRPGGVAVAFIDPEATQRWLMTLNDLRLTLGTRLNVREDDPPFDPGDPAQTPRLAYFWLTAVQDSLVTVLMR